MSAWGFPERNMREAIDQIKFCKMAQLYLHVLLVKSLKIARYQTNCKNQNKINTMAKKIENCFEFSFFPGMCFVEIELSVLLKSN